MPGYWNAHSDRDFEDPLGLNEPEDWDDPDAADPIQTHHICPPIPIRQFDWTAYRDPERRAGCGATEAEAIADLLEQEAEDDDV